MTTTFSGVSSGTAPGNPNNGAWTLSNGNLTTSRTPGGVTGINTATTGFNSGKYYWEVSVDAVGGGAMVGIVLSGTDITTDSPASGSYLYGSTGFLYHPTNFAYGNTYTSADVIAVAYDAGAGNLWFSKNGIWQNSATITEIQNGDTTHAAITGLSGTFYPGVSVLSSGGGAVTYTGNFGARGSFSAGAPSGYSSIDPPTGAGMNLVEDGADRLVKSINSPVMVPYH